MRWAYRGGCDNHDWDCCYYNSEENEDFYDTKEDAEAAMEEHFPAVNERMCQFWGKVFEVKK